MPAPIISGILEYIATELETTVFDGEVPRFDSEGRPINPASTVTGPTNWPVIRGEMQEPGQARNYAMGDAYDERGDVLIEVWGTTRASVETLINSIDILLSSHTNWSEISLPGAYDDANPYYIIQLLLKSWCVRQLEGERTKASQLIYRGTMNYDCHTHGAVATT